MSKKVNIGGDPNDISYRYKRDIIQVEKASKGMRKIANWSTICRQLKVGETFSARFFAEVKRRGNPVFNNGLFKGAISVADLEKILIEMTHKFLLCPKCKLPEWDGSSCNACGETKEAKMKENESEDDEPECHHVSDAVQHAKELYKLRLNGVTEADEILDVFWKLPICTDAGVSAEKCARTYKNFCANYSKWRASSSQSGADDPINK